MKAADQKTKLLIICVALNGYGRIYSQCIESQRKYASKQGYSYQLIDQSVNASITACAWLKIPLLIEALKQDYDWVVFIDSDCWVDIKTPPLESLYMEGKFIYMAQGFSGRINSGVIITRKHNSVLAMLEKIYANCNKALAEADWGENGHIIHYLTGWKALYILDQRWNNNADPSRQDFIRHYSAGAGMRGLYPATLADTFWRYFYRMKMYFRRNKFISRSETKQAVENLLYQVKS